MQIRSLAIRKVLSYKLIHSLHGSFIINILAYLNCMMEYSERKFVRCCMWSCSGAQTQHQVLKYSLILNQTIYQSPIHSY